MKAKRFGFVAALAASVMILHACGGGASEGASAGPPGAGSQAPSAESNDEATPEGMITAADLTLGDIDPAMAEKGKTTYDVKCQACHSMGENRVVGPGWKGITQRREPAWIMNMILNIDMMLAADEEAQKLLEQCLVRMPNQNLSKEEARDVLEFMRTL